MKTIKLFTIAVFIGFVFGQLSFGQNARKNYSNKIVYNNLSYRPWKSFKGDTLAYLIYNYGNINAGNDMRKKSFEGLKISDLFNELELPVTYIVGGLLRLDGGNARTAGIQLGIRQAGVLPSELIDYYIEVWFQEPLPSDTKIKLAPGTLWTPQMYEAIKNVGLLEVFFNAYYPPIGREDIIEKSKRGQRGT